MVEFEVSDTMKAENITNVNCHYAVLKIGEGVFSTTFGDLTGKDFTKAVLQRSITKNIGQESNLNIKGSFVETKNHNRINTPIPFEINIYSDLKGGLIQRADFVPDDWTRITCDWCGKECICNNCGGKSVWRKKENEC